MKSKKIEEILSLRFPLYAQYKASQLLAGKKIAGSQPSEKLKQQIESEKAVLEGKTNQELTELLIMLKNGGMKEPSRCAIEPIKVPTDNEKNAINDFLGGLVRDADFSYWGKMEFWTVDEAVALSFGKDPNDQNAHTSLSPFAKKYKELQTLIARSPTIQVPGSQSVITKTFVDWVKKHEIDFPNELAEIVDKKWGTPNWKELYGQLKALHDKNIVESTNLIKEQSSVIAELRGEIEELKQSNRTSRAPAPTSSEHKNDQNEQKFFVELPHMTKTLDVLFEVMRQNWSEYDPQRQPKQTNIAAELDRLLGWKPQKNGEPSRNAQALATAIRPDDLKESDARNKNRNKT